MVKFDDEELFVCIYHFLLQHKLPSNISKGPISPLRSDLPQRPQLSILHMVMLSFLITYLFIVLECASLVDSGHQSAMFGNPGPLFPMLIRTASPPLFPMPIPTASTPRLIPSQTVSSCLSRSPINPAPPPTPIPPASPPAPIPSQSIGPSLSWGLMMTPGEVQELLASEPQVGEYYVITKGRRPGVYLTW